MNTESIRYAVEVVAGLLPGGTPDPEFTKRWYVTSTQWAEAIADGIPGLTAEGSPWAEAAAYAASLVNPNRVNWVRIDWVWM